MFFIKGIKEPYFTDCKTNFKKQKSRPTSAIKFLFLLELLTNNFDEIVM